MSVQEEIRNAVLERMQIVRTEVNKLQQQLAEHPYSSIETSDVRIFLDGLLNQVNYLENHVHTIVVNYENTTP